MERKAAQRMARFSQMAVAASSMALADSGLDLSKEDDFRVGVDMGTGIGGFIEMTGGAISYATKGRLNPLYAPMIIPNMAAASVAMAFHLRGPNTTVTTACAASTHTLGDATRIIQHGDADVMLAGGSEASLCEVGISAFNAIRALSTRNDAPEKASRPFDRDRDGFVPGEGAATLVLEDLDHATARGARIYGEVIGYGATSDGVDMVAPSGEGAARCMKQALAGVKIPIDYINPHATSTPVGDIKEIEALRAVFGSGEKCPPISATKSLTGHSQGATGVHEAIYSLLMMQNGFICESAHIEEMDPEIADMPIVRKRRDNVSLRAVLSNSFGFGGANATLVFKHVDA
jgi:3-oxoacyl-[acyl-carrier-protein] synthase I